MFTIHHGLSGHAAHGEWQPTKAMRLAALLGTLIVVSIAVNALTILADSGLRRASTAAELLRPRGRGRAVGMLRQARSPACASPGKGCQRTGAFSLLTADADAAVTLERTPPSSCIGTCTKAAAFALHLPLRIYEKARPSLSIFYAADGDLGRRTPTTHKELEDVLLHGIASNCPEPGEARSQARLRRPANRVLRNAPAKASGRGSSTRWSTRACGERKSSFATIAACTKRVPANEHDRDIAGARSAVARHAFSAAALSGRQEQSRPVGGSRSARDAPAACSTAAPRPCASRFAKGARLRAPSCWCPTSSSSSKRRAMLAAAVPGENEARAAAQHILLEV